MDTLASYQSFLDKLGCPAFILDVREGAIAAINSAAVQCLGYSREECRGIALEQLLPSHESLPSPGASDSIVRVRHRNGSVPTIAFRVSPARMSEGDFLLMIGDGGDGASSRGGRLEAGLGVREPASELTVAFELIQELLDCANLETLCHRAEALAREHFGLQKCVLSLCPGDNGCHLEIPASGSNGDNGHVRPRLSSSWRDPRKEGWKVWELDSRIWSRTGWE
ncbi:MAG: PAS domain-containing protein, partial [Verrucomicrobiaceae bacterium]